MKNGRILAALLLAACSPEKVTVPQEDDILPAETAMTLRAEASDSHPWEEGDCIVVFTSAETDMPRLFICSRLDGKTGVFTGTARPGRQVCAVYPAEAATKAWMDGSLCLVDISIPAEQDQQSIQDVCIGTGEADQIFFKPVLATVRITLNAPAKDIDIASVRISGSGTENLSGPMQVMAYIGGGVPSSVPSAASGSLPVTLNGTWRATLSGPVTIAFPVAPTPLREGYKVSVTRTDGTISTQTFDAPLMLRPGTLTELEDFTFEGPHYYIDYTATSPITVVGYESEFDDATGEGRIYLDEPVLPAAFLNNHPELTSVTIPPFIEQIGNTALRACSNLERVVFEPGSRCTSIGDQAFQNDAKLGQIVIPAAVKTIGTGCFNACTALRSVSFEGGSVLETIKNNMLAGVQSLSEPLYIPGTLKNLGAAFNTKFKVPLVIHFQSVIPPTMTSTANPFNAAYLDKIYVPAQSLDAYKSANIWSKYADYMMGE